MPSAVGNIAVVVATNREVSGGLDPAAVTSQYRRGGSPVPSSSAPECSDSHELETLMAPGSHERGHLLEEASEEQSLMGSANRREEEDTPAPDPKVRVKGKKKSFLLFLFTPSYFHMRRRCLIFASLPCVVFRRLFGMAPSATTGATGSRDTETR